MYCPDGSGFYPDVKDGVRGYNTDQQRGADTFSPFSSGGGEVSIITANTKKLKDAGTGTIANPTYISWNHEDMSQYLHGKKLVGAYITTKGGYIRQGVTGGAQLITYVNAVEVTVDSENSTVTGEVKLGGGQWGSGNVYTVYGATYEATMHLIAVSEEEQWSKVTEETIVEYTTLYSGPAITSYDWTLDFTDVIYFDIGIDCYSNNSNYLPIGYITVPGDDSKYGYAGPGAGRGNGIVLNKNNLVGKQTISVTNVTGTSERVAYIRAYKKIDLGGGQEIATPDLLWVNPEPSLNSNEFNSKYGTIAIDLSEYEAIAVVFNQVTNIQFGGNMSNIVPVSDTEDWNSADLYYVAGETFTNANHDKKLSYRRIKVSKLGINYAGQGGADSERGSSFIFAIIREVYGYKKSPIPKNLS